EVLRVRPEAQPRAGVAPADAAGDLQLAGALAVGEGDVVLAAVALDVHLDPGAERVDDAHAHPVQAAGEGVVAVGELPAGVQPGEDQLDARHALLGVDVDRHAAAVVGHLAAAVGVQGHLDHPRVPGQRLVDSVVDHLLGQVVGPRGVGVHARPALDRVQARQDFDVGGVVAGIHLGRTAGRTA